MRRFQATWLRRVLASSGTWWDGLLLLALLAVVISVSRAYVSQERWFYYWDQAVHQDIAWQTAQAFGESWRAGLASVARSFNNDYNALFAIPFIPFMRGLGDTRLAFVTALSVVCLCPLALSLGVLATRLVSGSRRAVFWTGVWIALLVPINWVPTLRGFPDALPASLVVLALSIVLSERGLHWQRGAALSGALLAMAAILRRHFAYADLALFETVALYGLIRVTTALSAGTTRWREEARVTLLWLVVAGATAGGVLLTIGYGFVRRVMPFDFGALYRAYENATCVVLLSFLKPYGWLSLIAATAGLLLGALAGVTRRRRVAFLTLFGAVSGLQWLLVVRQVGENYTLHFTPVVVMGLLMFGWSLWRHASRGWRPVLAVATCVCLVTNGVLALSTLKFGKDAAWRPLLAGQWEPLRRYDYNAILNLVRFLREHAAEDKRVFVAASSHVINPDILRHAEWTHFPKGPESLNVLRVPEVDTRDEYPVGALVAAAFVVTAEPFQSHLPEDEQNTVRVAHDIFALNVAVARDFARLPDRFPLLAGTTVSVFQRTRETTLYAALDALRIAQEYLPRRPGTQSDWVVVGGPYPSWLVRLPDGTASWTAHPTPRGYLPPTAAVTAEAPPAVVQVSGAVDFVDARCPGTTLTFSGEKTGSAPWLLAEVQRRPGEDGHFQLRLDSKGADRLLLNLLNYTEYALFDHCLLRVHLVLQPDPAPAK